MNCFFLPAAIENPESRVSEMLEIIPNQNISRIIILKLYKNLKHIPEPGSVARQ